MKSFFVTRLSRWLGGVAAVSAMALVMTGSAWAATYYSQGSVTPNTLTNWNTVRGGGGSSPANFTTAGDLFVIQSTHNMSTSAAWTVSGTGATIQVESGGTLTANNLVAVPNFQIDNGGTYVHNAVSGAANGAAADVPGSTSRTFGASSTVEFQKWANGGTSPGPLPSGVTWGHLKINVATLAGSWQMSGALTTVAGNLIIQSTGGTTREFRLNANSPATSTLNLTGDLQVSGGIFNITSGTAVETFNIGGNLTLTGGTVTATGAGPHTVSFTGGVASVQFSQSAATLTATNINWTIASGKTLALNNSFTIAASRTLTVNGTLVRNTGGSVIVSGTLSYAGTGALVYNHSGLTSVGSEWTGTGAVGSGVPASVAMNGGGTLDLPSGTRGTPGNFTQSAGTINLNAVTLEVGGSMTVSTLTAGTSTVKFTSSSTASLTSGNPVTLNVFTVDKSGGSLALAADVSAAATTVSNGTLNIGTHTLSVSPLTVASSGTLQVGTGSTVTVTGNLQCDGTFSGGGLGTFIQFFGAPSTWSSGTPAQNFGEVNVLGGASVTLGTNVRCAQLIVNNNELQLSNKSLTVDRDVTVANTGTLKDQGTSALSVGRDLKVIGGGVFLGGGTLTFAGSGSWEDQAGTHNFGNVVIASGVTTTAGSTLNATSLSLTGSLDLGTETVVVTGNSDLNSGGSANLSAAGTLRTGGLRAFGGTVTGSVGTVELTGTPGQLGGTSTLSLAKLKINSGASATMAGNVSVTNLLTLAGGNVTTGANTLSVLPPATISRTSGHIVGNLKKLVETGTSTQTWEIGDATRYTPVSITGTGAGFASDFEAVGTTTSSDHGTLAASGIDPSHSVNRFHTITAPGYTGGTYDITLTFDPTDVDAPAAGNTASFIVRKNTGGTWTATTAGTRTATTTQATGLTGFSDFAIGEQGIDHYVVTASSPQAAGATFSTSVAAEDALNLPVSGDNTTAVTMTSNGSAAFDSNGDNTFGDNVKTLTGGAFTIDTKDNTAETVTLTATDGNSKTGQRTGLVIQAPLNITTTSLPNATAGTAYSQTVAATGGAGPYTWSIDSGSLPSGMVLESATGEIHGTATLATTSNFVVKVIDTASGSDTQALSITVDAGAATQLVATQQPGNTLAGATITPHFIVRLRDANGNNVTTSGVPVDVALTTGTGTLSGTTTRNTDATGSAEFDDLSINAAGTGKQLTASSGSLAPALSSFFDVFLSTEPTTQASALAFSNVATTSMDLNWTNGDGASRIVVAKEGSAVTGAPADGATYAADPSFGGGAGLDPGEYVVFNGTGNTVTVTDLTPSTTYHFAVFELNGSGGSENYLVTTPATGSQATTTADYTWNNPAGGSWTTATNWTPTRTTPNAADILRFDAVAGTVDNIPTETIAQLLITNCPGGLNLQAASAAVLTIGGGAGTDLSIDPASTVQLNGASTLTILVGAGATGVVDGGLLQFITAPHRLDAADAGGMTFQNGGRFFQRAGCTGNAFTNAGTADAIVFANTSIFQWSAGANPFALTAPASKVIFQPGSLYDQQQNAVPSFSGRTYGDYQLKSPGSNVTVTGASPVTIGKIRVAGGTLNINLTASVHIKGDIQVDGSNTLTFNPVSAATIVLDGSSVQTISGPGTLTLSGFSPVELNNAAGVSLSRNLTIPKTLTLTAGNVVTNGFVLTVGNTNGVIANGGHLVGNLKMTMRQVSGVASNTWPIGDGTHYTPVSLTGTSFPNDFDVTVSTTSSEHGDVAASGVDAGRSVNRYYTLSSSNYPGGAYDVTLTFDPTDVDGGATPANFVIRKNTDGVWTAPTMGTRTATTTQATGLTEFSDFVIGEQAIDHYVVTASSPQTVGATFSTTVSAEDALNVPVSTDNTTAVTMTSDASAEFDSNGDATFDDNVKTLTGGTFTIDTRDNAAETVTLTATDGNSKTGSSAPIVVQNIEPTTPATDLAFSNVGGISMDLNWTSGDGEARIVVAKQGSAVTGTPLDGTTYTANANFGGGAILDPGEYVVFNGSGNTVTVTGLSPLTTYHFSVFELNGSGGSENYLITTPATGSQATTVATYAWRGLGPTQPGNPKVWTNPLRWTPNRVSPAPSDILVFDNLSGNVNGVPTETIGQLLVVSGAVSSFFSASAGEVITIAGGTGTDLVVDAGTSLRLGGSNALSIVVGAGASGDIAGDVQLRDAPHRLDAVDAGAITFQSGSTLRQQGGCTGNVFTSAGTANAIVFASGSTFQWADGADPFALAEPSSKVVFNPGSLFSQEFNAVPSLSGRTYGDFDLTSTGSVINVGGSSPLSIGNLHVITGGIEIDMTGGFNLRGNLTVEADGALSINQSSTGTITLNGSATQTIGGTGALQINPGATVEVDNAAGVDLARDVEVQGTLQLTNGNVVTNANVLTVGTSASNGSVVATGGHVVGNLQRTMLESGGSASQTWPIGDATHFTPVSLTGSSFSGSFRVTASTTAGDRPDLTGSGVDPSKSVNRYFTLASSTYGSGPYDVTLTFDPTDLDGGATPANFVIRKNTGGTWTAPTMGTRTATTTQAIGLTGFSDFVIAEQAIDHYVVTASSPQSAGATFSTSVSAEDALNVPVSTDNSTAVTMTSNGSAEFDSNGDATFGDNVKTLTGGAFTIDTRDNTAETVTLTATDGNSKTGNSAGIVIQSPLTITTTSLPNATAGTAYSQTVAASGGTAPYTWSLDSGSLPSGLTLESATGELHGTATVAGTSNFVVKVTDNVLATDTQALSITVDPGAATQLVATQQPGNGTAGAVITPHFTVRLRDANGNNVLTSGVAVDVALTGGSGTLLGTLNRNTDANGSVGFNDLVINTAGTGKQLTASSGILTSAVSTSFDLAAGAPASLTWDVQPNNTAAGYPITPAVRLKVTDAFTNPVAGEAVSLALVGSGTLSGYAPTNTDVNGLATFPTLSVDLLGTKHLDASTGSLGPVSSSNFTISAGDPTSLTFDVQPSNAAAGATITPAVRVKVLDAFANPVAGEVVSLALVGSGTLSGYAPTNTDVNGIATFSTLSVNLVGTKHLDATSGSLGPVSSSSFTITTGAAAILSFDVQPTDALVNATITPAVKVKVTDGSGNPVASELVSLSLVGSGTLGGYAPANTDVNGIATFSTLSVNHSGNSKQLTATTGSLGPELSAPFNITCPPISVGPASLPAGTAGTPYSQFVSGSGGVAPYSYAVTAGSPPGGLGLNSGTGEISGTPGAAGTFNFTITATDDAGCTGSQAYSLTINSACPSITVLPASLPNGSLTVAYSQTLTASAGTAPFVFAVTVGSLPPGLSLSPGGALTGTPTTAGTYPFTVGVTDANSCTGSTAYSITILAVPAAVTNLAAVQLLTGNDTDGSTKITLTWTMPPGAATAQVYRAGFGNYPEYDDAGGAVPPTPSYPPTSPWVLTSVTASGQTDEPATRDFYYYVVFVKNAAGGTSAVSNKTGGSLNYHLGDVSNGITLGQGNNGVGDEDVSLLGAHYGITGATITTQNVAYLDVGPTTNLQMTSRPFTDDRIDFEDLIVFAANYHVVSKATPVASEAGSTPSGGPEEFSVSAPSLVEEGSIVTAVLRLKAGGRVQGFSAELGWDPTVVSPEGWTSSQWVEGQGGLVLSPSLGTVDAALLGVGPVGLEGDGEVAQVRFRVLRTGNAGIRLNSLVARDAANQNLGGGVLVQRVDVQRPTGTVLMSPSPNPFQTRAGVEFSLAEPGAVELSVYGVDGRRVRTLVREQREAGVYREAWDGRDDGQRAVGSGVFYVHLVAGGRRFTKTIVFVK